ncbi:DNA primase, partial [Paenibacillus sp. HN-1]
TAHEERMIFIIFNQSVAEKDQDKDLLEKLLSEKDFIVSWALEELRDLVRSDFIFTEGEDAVQFRKQLSENSESIAQFLGDLCEIDPNNKGLKVLRKHLYPAYMQYCKDNCLKSCSQEELFREVMRLGVVKGKFRMFGSNALRGFQGIRLKNTNS